MYFSVSDAERWIEGEARRAQNRPDHNESELIALTKKDTVVSLCCILLSGPFDPGEILVIHDGMYLQENKSFRIGSVPNQDDRQFSFMRHLAELMTSYQLQIGVGFC
jgi:hypothetical protein